MANEMKKEDALGSRMKEFYENASKTYLTRRTPVILRLDGKAFHTLTKGCIKPFDFNIENDKKKAMVDIKKGTAMAWKYVKK